MNDTNSVLVWSNIRWTEVQQRVRRVQRRIYKARVEGKISKVHWLQKLLINSLDAKLVAVQQVTTLNKGRKTAGVDRKFINNGKDKVNLALKLEINGDASPIRRVWIPKPGKNEKRPLGIPTISDRARQALCKLALEPEWEAVFEPNSYGFRPGRSAHDAIESIFLSLRHKRTKFVFDADIRKCFDRINHKSILNKLNTFPQMEKQIAAWLTADIMEGYANTPKEVTTSTMGTPQGGIISPLLANIALHGLENHLKDFVVKLDFKAQSKTAKRKSVSIIRYADDFVIIHEKLEVLETCVLETRNWLQTVGLELNEEKSSIKDGRNGFLFLGFQIILVMKQDQIKVKIHPSTTSKTRFLEKVRQIIQNNKAASTYQLIMKLRPLILGWSNYFKYCECTQDFQLLSHRIFQKIRAWVFRRDTRNGRKFIKSRYFPTGRVFNFDGSEHQNNWVLCGKYKSAKAGMIEAYLPPISWVKSKKHVKVQGSRSPYDGDYLYWSKRSMKYSSLPTRVTTLFVKQSGRCTICNKAFLPTDVMEVDHIQPKRLGGKDTYNNLQLLHRHCHVSKTANEFRTIRLPELNKMPLQELDEGKPSRPVLKTSFDSNIEI